MRHHLDRPASGQTVRLAPGDVLEVRLVQASGGGYLWSVADLTGALEVAEDRTVPGLLPGAAADRVLAFRAGTPGHGRIRLVQGRPWETSPHDEVVIDVDIEQDVDTDG